MPDNIANMVLNAVFIGISVSIPFTIVSWTLKNYLKDLKEVTKENTKKMISLEIEMPKTYVKTDDFKFIQSEVSKHDGQLKVINHKLNIIN